MNTQQLLKKQVLAYFLAGGVILVGGGAYLVNWCTSLSPWKLRTELQTVSPLCLEIIFGLFIVAAITNIKNFRTLFSPIQKYVWLLLCGIIVAGVFITALLAPREHRIYYDEDIYENIGQNIAVLKKAGMCNEGTNDFGEYQCLRLEYNKQPNSWPYILSVVFRIFGVSETASFLTNNAMYSLSIAVAFCIAFLLFGSHIPALYAALLFALIPEGIIWSNTVTVEPSTVLFTGLTILSCLLVCKTGNAPAFFLMCTLAAFTAQFRTESALVLVYPCLSVLLFRPKEFLTGRMFFWMVLVFILLIPHLAHLYAVRNESWGASGAKLSLEYFDENFRVNSLFYLKNIRFPALFTVFFFLGLLLHRREWSPSVGTDALTPPLRRFLRMLGRQRHHWREKSVLLVWFLITWGIFLFFYAGSYNFGVDVRYSLVSHMAIAIIAGYGAAALHKLCSHKLRLPWAHSILCAVILFSFLSFTPLIRTSGPLAWAARADHILAEQWARQVPDHAVILTHNPNMFLVWGKNAAQASLATEDAPYFKHFFRRYTGGVYFHYNFWCNVQDRVQVGFCNNILKRYKCTQLETETIKDYTFGLYTVERK